MQKLTEWFVSKGLLILCIFIICIAFPTAIFYWNTHPQAVAVVDTTVSTAVGNDDADLVLPENAGPPPLPAGTKAVDFPSTTVDGKNYIFDCHSKNIKVLEFWATWCGPCHMSIPAMEDIYNDFKSQGVEVIGISADTDTANQVPETVKELGMTYPVLVDPKNNVATQETYNVQSLPTVYIIDDKGIVQWSFSGYWPGEEAYMRKIITNLQIGKPAGLP